jgi:hypothetical protein
MSDRERVEDRVPKLVAQLDSAEPARLHPRPDRTLDRRRALETSLRLARLKLRRHHLRGADKLGAR